MDECNTTVRTFILNTYYSHRADTFNMFTLNIFFAVNVFIAIFYLFIYEVTI